MSADTVLVTAAIRLYGAALRLCPRAVRDRYGDDMRDTFADRCRDAAGRGHAAIVVLLARELADLARTRIGARSRGSRIEPRPQTHALPRSLPVTSFLHDIR